MPDIVDLKQGKGVALKLLVAAFNWGIGPSELKAGHWGTAHRCRYEGIWHNLHLRKDIVAK